MIIVRRTFAGQEAKGDVFLPSEALVDLAETALKPRGIIQELKLGRRTCKLSLARSGLEEVSYEGYLREMKPLVAVAACYYMSTPDRPHKPLGDMLLAQALQNQSNPHWQDYWWATLKEIELEKVTGKNAVAGSILLAGRVFPVRAFLGIPFDILLIRAAHAVHVHKPLEEVIRQHLG